MTVYTKPVKSTSDLVKGKDYKINYKGDRTEGIPSWTGVAKFVALAPEFGESTGLFVCSDGVEAHFAMQDIVCEIRKD